MHCMESPFFLYMRKKHTASTDWNDLLFCPVGWLLGPRELRTTFFFSFLFLFFRTGICAQSENWESRTYREHNKTRDSQTQILVPRFTRKQSKGGMTRSNIQNTKKKSYLKVALSFCCKREEGNYAMWWWCLFFSFSFFFFVLFMNGLTDWTLPPKLLKQLGAKKKTKNKQVL